MLKYLFLFVLLSGSAIAQNLVPNPGFEDAWTCPDSYTKEQITNFLPGWIVPNHATPDYFNRCNKEDVGVPNNFVGSMEPKEGNAYVGLILKESYNPKDVTFNPEKNEYSREYLSSKLLKPLKRTKLYCISFYWALAKFSDYAVDGIGIYFSKEKIHIKNDGIITAKQQLFKKDKLLKTKNKWEEFCGVIMPHGGEKYITIGNFTATKDIQYSKIDSIENNLLSKYAYYLIDDVQVFPIENEFECGCSGGSAEVIKDYMVQNINLNKQNTNTYNIAKNNSKNNIELDNDTNKKNSNTNQTIEGVDNIKELESGISVTLKNIFFALEESKLTDKSFTELNKLVQLMLDNPDMSIDITGHSDNTGTDVYNLKLSEDRAKAVADYLRAKKIKKKRLSWNGRGNTQPIANNDTDEGRAKNRRVEITIIKK